MARLWRMSPTDSVATPPVAVILARGLGTRMRASTGSELDPATAAIAATGVKALVPVADRPFLDYVLADVAAAGMTEAILVIGPEHEQLRAYYRALPTTRLRISFALQAQARGTADAVFAANEAVGARRCVVLNSDNRYPPAALAALIRLPGEGLVAFRASGLLRGNIPAERLQRFALVRTALHRLQAIIEKPDAAERAGFGADPLVSMNCWCLDPATVRACAEVPVSARGELELTDAIRRRLASGAEFRVVESDEAVLDLTGRDDVASVRQALAGVEVRL